MAWDLSLSPCPGHCNWGPSWSPNMPGSLAETTELQSHPTSTGVRSRGCGVRPLCNSGLPLTRGGASTSHLTLECGRRKPERMRGFNQSARDHLALSLIEEILTESLLCPTHRSGPWETTITKKDMYHFYPRGA